MRRAAVAGALAVALLVAALIAGDSLRNSRADVTSSLGATDCCGFTTEWGGVRIGPGTIQGTFPVVTIAAHSGLRSFPSLTSQTEPGAYVDDTTPNRCFWAGWLSSRGYRPVIVAAAPGFRPGCPALPGEVFVEEWYPFGCDDWGSLPLWQGDNRGRWAGYILQDGYRWPNCPAPTGAQIERLRSEVFRLRPRPLLILGYRGNP